MFKATKRTLTAAAVIVAASGPSAAYARLDLNPSPRGVAIVLAQASAGPVVRSNPGQQTPPTTDSGAADSVPVASVPRCPRVGPCISPYTVVTHGSGGRGVQNGRALERQREAVPVGSSPGVRAPALFGGAGTPYPGTTVTRYPGLVPGSTTTRYPGLVPEVGGPSAQSGEPRGVQAPASAPVTGLAALNHEQAVAEKALAANLVGRNHAGEASRLTAIRTPAVATTGGGFDWGDGAIGALVVLGVMAAGFGATVLVRRSSNSLARTES